MTDLPPRRPRRLLARLVFTAVGLALPLVLAEAVLRILDPAHSAEAIDRERFSAAILERGANGALALRPDTRATLFGQIAEIGAHGLRNPIIEEPKPAGRFRILVIGDSVAFGWGVAATDSFPRRLEAELRRTPLAGIGADVEVINAACPGWGVPHYLQLLRDRGLSWRPDLVIVTLINNDLTDILEALDQRERPRPFTLPSFLRWSYLARVVEQTVAKFGGGAAPADFFLAIDVDPVARGRAESAICDAFGAMKSMLGEVPLCVLDTIVGSRGERLTGLVECSASRGFTLVPASLARPDYKESFAVGKTDDHPNAAGHAELCRIVLEWLRSR